MRGMLINFASEGISVQHNANISDSHVIALMSLSYSPRKYDSFYQIPNRRVDGSLYTFQRFSSECIKDRSNIIYSSRLTEFPIVCSTR